MTSNDSSIEALFQRYGPSYRWLLTFNVMIGAIAMGFATSMVNVAVPAVMGAYGVGLDQAQWISTGFLATMSATMLLSSWLIEVFGQRNTYIATLIAFGAGALMSATAQNIDTMILGRILQGAATGVGQPLAMFSIYTVFPPERRGTAMGLYGLGTVLAPTFGPILGGIAIDTLSWRYLFLLPLPFCVPALLLSLVYMPSKKITRPFPSFDWTGLALILIASFSILSGLSNGQRWGWGSNQILLRLLGGGGTMMIFVFWEMRATNPLLDMSLFRDRQFTLTMVAGFVFGAGLFASSYFIPVFVQTIQNYNATTAGLLLAPGGLVMMLFFPLAGRITDSIPAHVPIATGLMIFSIGFFLMSVIDVNTTFWVLVVYTLVNRVGLSLAIPSLSVAALRAVPPDKLARGASSSTFFRNLGGGFGIALLTAFFEYRSRFHGEAITATQTAANATTFEFLGNVRQLLETHGLSRQDQAFGALNYLSSVIQAQANTLSFQDTFLAIAVVSLLAVGPAWMIGHRARGRIT
jgi:EmrB/QacA subfamily drug resistance transporter